MQGQFLWLGLAMLVSLSAPSSVSAGIHFESTIMGMKVKTWTSGFKQRLEVNAWSGGKPLTVITRVDRKVKWTLDLEKKIYLEETLKAEIDFDHKNTSAFWPGENEACRGMVTRLPNSEEIAGHRVTGYEILCQGDSGQRLMLWLASIAGPMHLVEQETRAFEEALYAIQHPGLSQGNSSVKALGLGTLSMLFGAIFSKIIQEGQVLPEGIPMALESITSAGSLDARPMKIYEVTQVDVGTMDSSLFRVPGGFRKVDRLPGFRLRGLMRQLQAEEMSEAVKNILNAP